MWDEAVKINGHDPEFHRKRILKTELLQCGNLAFRLDPFSLELTKIVRLHSYHRYYLSHGIMSSSTS
jgi:hypothetical protein